MLGLALTTASAGAAHAFIDRLLPAPRDGGFRRDDAWIWCGSVIRGDDGQWHLFASMWTKQDAFTPNWLTNSRVVRAVARSSVPVLSRLRTCP